MRESIDKALQLYTELSKSPYGFIEKTDGNRHYFIDMLDNNVSMVLDSICENFKVNIFKTQNRIYLVPLTDSILATNEEDISRYFHATSNSNKRENDERLYLFYYITLVYLNEIYGGTPFKKLNDYITLGNFIRAVDESVERALSFTKEDDYANRFNTTAVAKKWSSFILQNDSNTSSKINIMATKIGFIKKVINFLKKEGLVDVKTIDDERIYPTTKLTDIMLIGGLNMSKIEDLKIKVQNNGISNDNDYC